jgi:hypothetical protein
VDIVDIVIDLPKPPSLNMIYAGKHWAVRKKYKDDYKKIIRERLEEIDGFTCETYSLDIRYNSRLDIDNGILVSKFLSDTLVEDGCVQDDSPKYFKEVRIRYDKEVEMNHYIVTIKCKNYKPL